MTPDKQAALDEYQRAVEAYTSRKLNRFDTQGNMFNYEQGQSGLNDIQTDPRYKEHELTALRDLEDQSRNGFTAKDQADITRVENQQNRAHSGRTASIMQNMHSRGMGGSGLDLAAQLQSSQDANEMAAMRGLEQEGMMQDRKRSATRDLGQMSGQIQGRDFAQASSKAQAQDQINQFNINNRNRANEWNVNNAQHVADQNTQASNQYGQGNFEAKAGLAKVHYDSAQGEYMQGVARKEARDKKRKGMMSGIFGAAGAVAGGMAGSSAGPAGTLYGATAGAKAGDAIGSAFSHGGYIPGKANVHGDDPSNDTEQVNLSPGELVIPRSIAGNPKLAAKYAKHMAHLKEIIGAKHQGKSNYAQGGYIEPNQSAPGGDWWDEKPANASVANAFGPLDMPASADLGAPDMPDETHPNMDGGDGLFGFHLFGDKGKKDAMSPDERTKFEDYTKDMNPLVKSYLEDRIKSKKDYEKASDMKAYSGMANVAGNLFTDLKNSQKTIHIGGNNWDHMGDDPKISSSPDAKWDNTVLDKFGDSGIKHAEDKYKIAQAGLDKSLDRDSREKDRKQYYDMQEARDSALAESKMSDEQWLAYNADLYEAGKLSPQRKRVYEFMLSNRGKNAGLDGKNDIEREKMQLERDKLEHQGKSEDNRFANDTKKQEMEFKNTTELNKIKSAAEKEKESLKNKFDRDSMERKAQIDKELALLKAKIDSEKAKLDGKIKENEAKAPKPLSNETAKLRRQATDALKGLRLMRKAMMSPGFSNTDKKKIFSDNNFTTGQSLFVDNYGHYQTGAVVNENEEKTYKGFTPGLFENRSAALNKMDLMEGFLVQNIRDIDANHRGETLADPGSSAMINVTYHGKVMQIKASNLAKFNAKVAAEAKKGGK